jgi:hypothetical protein
MRDAPPRDLLPAPPQPGGPAVVAFCFRDCNPPSPSPLLRYSSIELRDRDIRRYRYDYCHGYGRRSISANQYSPQSGKASRDRAFNSRSLGNIPDEGDATKATAMISRPSFVVEASWPVTRQMRLPASRVIL